MTCRIANDALVAAEDSLIAHIRQHAVLISQAGYCIPDDWKYESSFHMLLALGRRFTPAPPPEGMIGMPEGACYSNSAQYAQDHQDQGLVYAEGFALTHSEGGCYVPHAWAVQPTPASGPSTGAGSFTTSTATCPCSVTASRTTRSPTSAAHSAPTILSGGSPPHPKRAPAQRRPCPCARHLVSPGGRPHHRSRTGRATDDGTDDAARHVPG